MKGAGKLCDGSEGTLSFVWPSLVGTARENQLRVACSKVSSRTPPRVATVPEPLMTLPGTVGLGGIERGSRHSRTHVIDNNEWLLMLGTSMRGDQRSHHEIVDAYRSGDLYFAAIAISRDGIERVFELGISKASYSALRRVLQMRPFDTMPGVQHRYFFLPIYSRNPSSSATCDIRIEQGKDGRGFRFELPKDLIANLLWFDEMQSFETAKHLRSWVPGGRR